MGMNILRLNVMPQELFLDLTGYFATRLNVLQAYFAYTQSPETVEEINSMYEMNDFILGIDAKANAQIELIEAGRFLRGAGYHQEGTQIIITASHEQLFKDCFSESSPFYKKANEPVLID